MSKVLISLLILVVASAAAVSSGLISRSGISGLVNRLKLKGSMCFWVLTRLVNGAKLKDLIGQLKQAGSSGDFTSRILRDAKPDSAQDPYAPLDMRILNCRVRMIELKEGDTVIDAFALEICGAIHAPEDIRSATLRISIQDITDGSIDAKEVRARNPQGAASGKSNGSEFCYVGELGRLPRQTTTLEGWTCVARLRSDGHEFCRRGKRTLRFDTSILSADGDAELAHAWCTFVYSNPLPGYVDLQENDERTKVLAVALAFAVSAADGKLYDCEVELIKDWARKNVLESPAHTSDQAGGKLEKALSTTVAYFSEGNKLDIYSLCAEVVEIAPVGRRYEVLELCLRVAQANGSVAAEEMAVLKDLASWLEIDVERFRTMIEKILPVDMHEIMDINDLLGITSDMSREKTRKHLNREYSKWNSRVTSANPEIQTQADQMLKIIAEARGQYVSSGR